MSGSVKVRESVLEAIRTGKLPNRPPDRIWGGLACGASCALCGQRFNSDELEFGLEFAAADNGTPPVQYHVHLACYSTWKAERRNLEYRPGTGAIELSGAVAETTVGGDELEPPAEGPA